MQDDGRLSDFVLSQSKVGGYLSEEDAVILDNWLKELSTRYDFQNNFDYCGDIYTRSDYEPDFYDYLNWIEENATSGFYKIIYRWLVDEEFDKYKKNGQESYEYDFLVNLFIKFPFLSFEEYQMR